MKLFLVKFGLINGTALFYLFISHPIVAQQIIQDTTLPENSVITQEGNRIQIDGGTSSGNNLFHSFEKFTVSPNNTAVFNNPINIQNIFSRVTGSTRSNIDGIIQANGTANLFLINPNGIIFGENASLNIGGSFFATTADSIHFTDGTQFSATKPLEQPLLTINTPIGLGFGETPKDIVNKSRASDRSGQFFAGLQVEFGKTLALVGGQVSLEGGFLTAEGGRVELGSVGANNFVSLTPNSDGWILGYEESQSFQDISLSEAFINVIGRKSGDVQIQGKSVLLTEGSQILAISFAEGQAGNVEIKASELVKLEGASENIGTITSIFNEVEGEATGNGSELIIETEKLIIKDGAQLSTGTFGSGQGVALRVNASTSVELEGSSNTLENDRPSGLFARVQPEATGNGGKITLNTGQLIIKDGAQVSNDTRGIGNAGDLEISASEFILLEGTNLDNTGVSGIFSQVATGASGDAGNLTIETGQLNILDGAQISTSARSSGQGGSLTINASDFILVSGTSPLGDAFSSSNILVSAELGATKDAGSLIIETGELTVEKGAKISADNFGTGKGANVTLNVEKLTLKDGGTIGAGSLLQPIGLVEEAIVSNERGSGGTLTINAQESIEVTGSGFIGDTPVKSSLFTRAEGTGDAGDLIINTPNLTVSNQGEITAQSLGTGEGGDITLTGKELTINNVRLLLLLPVLKEETLSLI
ncbi:MAG: filamentous hemagglutinin N-terminal domain-containing protein [Xenococcaceae cyanobacterium MO_207.B15]|nr:filamentous hemagglutinin N-terminal domain-containing protein [Xenococcaceae cyanobacterium MO_207.B15]